MKVAVLRTAVKEILCKTYRFVTVFSTVEFCVGTVESCPHAHCLFSEHTILLPVHGFLSFEDFQFNLHMQMNMLHILQVLPFVI